MTSLIKTNTWQNVLYSNECSYSTFFATFVHSASLQRSMYTGLDASPLHVISSLPYQVSNCISAHITNYIYLEAPQGRLWVIISPIWKQHSSPPLQVSYVCWLLTSVTSHTIRRELLLLQTQYDTIWREQTKWKLFLWRVNNAHPDLKFFATVTTGFRVKNFPAV